MKKILLIAYDLNPNKGSECLQGYLWLKILAKHFEVHAFVCDAHRQDIERTQLQNTNISFIRVSPYLRWFASKTGLYFLPIAEFMRKIEFVLNDKLSNDEFELIHYLTPSGIHSYNSFYKKFNLPYIVGPVGGALPTPDNFKKAFYFKERLAEKGRRLFYFLIKKIPAWNQYFINARKILIGTEYLLRMLPVSVKNKTVVIFDTVIDMNEFKSVVTTPRRNFIQIVYSGRLSTIKGILLLISAIKLLKDKNRDVYSKIKVLILGDGPLRKDAEQLVDKHGLHSAIQLLGQVPRRKVITILQESDIFCLPTIRDNGCGAILEAMGAGLPIITSNYGGPKYSVTDDCGIKIEVSNYIQYVQDLAIAIVKLVSNEDLRRKTGENARRRVEQEFSLDALETNILNLYADVLYKK